MREPLPYETLRRLAPRSGFVQPFVQPFVRPEPVGHAVVWASISFWPKRRHTPLLLVTRTLGRISAAPPIHNHKDLMKTTFTLVVERLRQVDALNNAEEAGIKSSTIGEEGMLVMGSESAQDYRAEPRPCHAALAAFIQSIPVEHVYALTALMYAGRDNETDPVSLWSDLKDTVTTKEQACRAILEKSPRMSYIDKALSTLPKGMDIDQLPRLVSTA